MALSSVFAVIMAGGKGERLWPLSVPERPKQFLSLSGSRTMLQETVARVAPLISQKNIYVVTPREFATLVLEQLYLPEENIILEPMGRGTAPCIGLAAVLLEAKDPHSVMVVLPSDHVVKEQERFLRILKLAIEIAAKEDCLVTLGIIPDYPATGYGYIRRGELFAKNNGLEIYRVQSFTEKPDYRTARRFLEEGDYYWNSGMFVWRVDVILGEISRCLPKLYAGLIKIKKRLGKPELNRVIAEVYEEQESISIDYGVMEKAKNVLVIPAEIGWSDLGDWLALEALFEKNNEGNIIQAQHIGIDTKNSIVFATDKDKLIATIGLENIVIVETKEALLVMEKTRAQEVREIVNKIKQQK